MNSTITIHKVAPALLDKQRLDLVEAMDVIKTAVTGEQFDSVTAISNMLDDWSDNNQELIAFHRGHDGRKL